MYLKRNDQARILISVSLMHARKHRFPGPAGSIRIDGIPGDAACRWPVKIHIHVDRIVIPSTARSLSTMRTALVASRRTAAGVDAIEAVAGRSLQGRRTCADRNIDGAPGSVAETNRMIGRVRVLL
jgi:hypothetical protein